MNRDRVRGRTHRTRKGRLKGLASVKVVPSQSTRDRIAHDARDPTYASESGSTPLVVCAAGSAVRFLVTGGAGFIGSHLAGRLIENGHSVHVLDDFSTGALANMAQLASDPAFAYTVGSAASPGIVADLVDEADVVYHLAAAVGVELIVDSPVRTIQTNVRCTEVVLAEATRRRKPVFVASTSEVYGKSADLPFRETGDLVLGPTKRGRWSYACSKALDEFLALAYWKERGLPAVVGRLFNTAGPRQAGCYGMVVPTFVRQALAGSAIRVYGDGTQRRCFCHVVDVVSALVDLMGTERAYGQVFNIGGTEEITIRDLAERVREHTGSSSEIVLVPYEQAYEAGFEDVRRRVPDTSKIHALTGWTPRRGLADIIDDVVLEQRASSQLVESRG